MPGTPYITPQMLVSAPTGISWDIIPEPGASEEQQLAEQTNICWRATHIVDTYCNQPLRATVDTETVFGPDFRVTVEQGTGNARIILQRWPVMQIIAIAVSGAATFPRQWSLVPSGMWAIEYPTLGVYGSSAPSAAAEGGQTITVAPGYISWALGRRGYTAQVSYTNGWPHTSLTAAAAAGATTLQVDDVTGWTGAGGYVYDDSFTETITASSVTATTPLTLPNGAGTAPAGPGTLTLSSPLAHPHNAGVLVSSLPGDVLWATIMAATAQALESGIVAVTIQNLPGSETVGGHGIEELQAEYEVLLEPFRRVI